MEKKIKIIQNQKTLNEGFYYVYLNNTIQKAFSYETMPGAFRPKEEAFKLAIEYAESLKTFEPIDDVVVWTNEQ